MAEGKDILPITPSVTTDNDNNKSSKRAPASRSRNGCIQCRKMKIKCDETKPVCSNCLKAKKECDYTIKLVWGGRPYKKPKIEKLNRFSNNISSTTPTPTPILKAKRMKSVDFENLSTDQVFNTLNPIDNLNQLLKRSKKNKNVVHQSSPATQLPNLFDPAIEEISIQQTPQSTQTESQLQLQLQLQSQSQSQLQSQLQLQLQSQSQSQTQTQSESQTHIPIPIPVPNINSIIDTLGSFYDNKVTQSLPWPVLEEIDTIDLIKEPMMGSEDLMLSPITPFDFDVSDPPDPSSPNNLMSIPLINEHRQISTTASTASLIVEPIPRGLLPLPDILLNSPQFYESFQHYVHSTTNVLTPADNTVYKNNPFKYVLPKLAMTNDGLMSLIVAFGLAHKSMLSKTDSTQLIDSLLSRALGDLLVLLNNKETSTSDLTLTIVMLFCSFLAFNYQSDKWKVHMNGAKQIILMRGYNKPFGKLLSDLKDDGSLITGEIKKTKLVYFLIRWFAYVDIFTRLSSPLTPTNEDIIKYLSSDNSDILSPISEASIYSEDSHQPIDDSSQMNYEMDEIHQALIKDESFDGIDYMIGFNLKLLPIFSQLCDLIKYVNLQKKMNDGLKVNLSPKLIENAINIQNKFESLKNTSYVAGFTSLNTVIATNSCFIYMGLIQLYKRVLLMNADSKLIQSLCAQTLDIFEKYIDTKIPNAVTLIFPLFVAGCEIRTSDMEIKQKFIDMMHDLKQSGSSSADCATEVMITCWNTGANWYDVMRDENRLEVFL